MRIYLAAPYARAKAMEAAAERLTNENHEVVSKWHGRGVPEATTLVEKRFASALDTEDMLRAEAFLFFTEPANASPFSSGGRHVEAGFALALSMFHDRLSRPKPFLLSVGPVENVYYAAPQFARCLDIDAAVELLAMEEVFRAKAKSPR